MKLEIQHHWDRVLEWPKFLYSSEFAVNVDDSPIAADGGLDPAPLPDQAENVQICCGGVGGEGLGRRDFNMSVLTQKSGTQTRG